MDVRPERLTYNAAFKTIREPTWNSPRYGSALLGYHDYTWAFIGFALAIVLIAAVLMFDDQFDEGGAAPQIGAFAHGAVLLVIGLTALNVISTLLQCGFAACADNPTIYEMLRRSA
jgi:hypothetical protein